MLLKSVKTRFVPMLLMFVLVLPWIVGCASRQQRLRESFPHGLPDPSLATSFRIYRGDTGERVGLDEVARDAAGADAIFFGEHHNQPVCNAVSAVLFQELIAQRRPVALAMEFFTRDDQEALDDYLAGKIDEPTFQEATNKGRRYLLSHRPLIELARGSGSDVIGGGVARSRWSEWRESGIEEYSEWYASLPADTRSSFPRECVQLKDAYWEAIQAFSHGGDADEEPSEEERAEMEAQQWSFFKTQCLWDDSFAEAMTDAMADDEDLRTYLVVGAFHVQRGLGTVTKYRMRRPEDRIVTISMSSTHRAGYDLSFDESDRGLADYVLYTVVTPPPPPEPEVDEDESEGEGEDGDEGEGTVEEITEIEPQAEVDPVEGTTDGSSSGADQ